MSAIINELLKDVRLPEVIKVVQRFSCRQVADVAAAVRAEFNLPGIGDRIKGGMRIALAVGSRGMAALPLIVNTVAAEVKKRGAIPFIVPGMGSHGGATAQGQINVLARLGVTENSAGCPILASMDVVEVGRLDNGLPVLMDKYAYESDGIIPINRIKPHNAFSGPNESGLAKMLAIGLGKQQGADACHAFGFGYMAEFIVKMAKIKIEKCPVLFGIGTVENAYDQVMKIAAIPAERIIEQERELLLEAKANMPRIPFNTLDVLVVDQLGKEFSGGGMDSNITGRHPTPFISGGPSISRIAVLDVTDLSHGNANGVGMADVITRRLFAKIDFDAVYANALTSTVTESARIPMIMDNELDAIKAAIKTAHVLDKRKIRLVRIKNTLDLSVMYISQALYAEAAANHSLDIIGALAPMSFDAEGNLLDAW